MIVAVRCNDWQRPLPILSAFADNEEGLGKLPVRYVLSPCLLWGSSHFEPCFFITTLLDDQYFVVLKGLVAAGDDALAWLQTLQYLVVLWILAAYADVAAIGFCATLVEDEYPLSACGLKERAARDEDGLLWLTQFEVDVIGLACADVLWTLALENEVTAELALAHLRIDLAHLQLILLVTTGESGCESLTNAVDIMLVDLCLHLIVREIVQLSDLLSWLDALA